MTREEAIRIIKIVLAVVADFEIKVNGEKFTKKKCKEAVEIAVKALEQEPCTDAISRQAVLEKAIRVPIARVVTEDKVIYRKIVFADEIENLPPVKPVEKVGHWIMHIDDLFPAESTMECNKCHEHQPITIDDNYCPSCGAKMQEVKE